MKIGVSVRTRRPGFTLVELLVVGMIVAILAAVAVPLFRGNRESAMITEAVSALGTARTALRVLWSETKAYDRLPNGEALAPGDPLHKIPGLSQDALQGRYFAPQDYSILAIGPNHYQLQAYGRTGDVAGLVVILDQDGNFYRTRLSELPGNPPPSEGPPWGPGPPPWAPGPPPWARPWRPR